MRVHIEKQHNLMVLVFRNEGEIVDVLTDLAVFFKHHRGGANGGFPIAVGFDLGDCKLTHAEREAVLRRVLHPGEQGGAPQGGDLRMNVV